MEERGTEDKIALKGVLVEKNLVIPGRTLVVL